MILGLPWHDVAMYAVVVCVGIPASFRSPVALVLLAWWLIGMGVWWAFGALPPAFSVAFDLIALGLFARYAVTGLELLAGLLFIVTICSHLMLDQWGDWQASWLIGLGQFLLVGGSALQMRTWGYARHVAECCREVGDLFAALGRVWSLR